MIAELVKTLLEQIVPAAYPLVAPMSASRPYATYQQVGGQSMSFLGSDLPSLVNGRIQVNVYADTLGAAQSAALQIENAFMQSTAMQAEPLGSATDTHEDGVEPPLFGTRQDFSVWVDR